VGGGRPINGYFNNGGGIVVLSSYALDNHAFIQSTLQHELGHAFGLVHVDVYGRSMDTDISMMSYNPAHHTNGFVDAAEPGVFGAEDRAALALNQRVFPGLTYGGPPGATLIALGPMTLPGLPTLTLPSLPSLSFDISIPLPDLLGFGLPSMTLSFYICSLRFEAIALPALAA
jgi:hypothetical protein